MSTYESYQHIVRMGDDEVEGILDPFGGDTIITVQPKIDGTNATRAWLERYSRHILP